MNEADHERTGINWLVLEDHEQSVLAFARFGRSGKPVVVVSNMTPVVRHDYRVGVPVSAPGKAGSDDEWHELLNTDDSVYGGSGVSNAPQRAADLASHGQTCSLSLTLPPLATVILQPV